MSVENQPAWKFPPTHGGTIQGFSHGGITHFEGQRSRHLAREIIQNSVDAQQADDLPVDITFEICNAPKGEELGYKQLLTVTEKCIELLGDSSAVNDTRKKLEAIKSRLSKPRLRFLRIADENTTGLDSEERWNALVKSEGSSVAKPDGSGGSFGQGKNAVFAVSPIRTAFYHTKFWEGMDLKTKFQGKSILASHKDPNDDDMRTNIGFFGHPDQCEPLCDDEIPKWLNSLELNKHHNRTPKGPDQGQGTSIYVAEYDDTHWQPVVAADVVTNYFGAIQKKNLKVMLEPYGPWNQGDEPWNFDTMEITDETLPKWFAGLGAWKDFDQEFKSSIKNSRLMWELMKSSPSKEWEIPGFGLCRFWIKVSDDLPSRVGIMRKTGMLITDEQKGLKRFSGCENFIAVCQVIGNKGNDILRAMENPTHDAFEPDRVAEEDRDKYKKLLKVLIKKLRDTITETAGSPADGQQMDATLVAQMLPLLDEHDPEDDFSSQSASHDNDAAPEDAFSRTVVRLKRRRPARPTTGGASSGEEGDDSVIDETGDGEGEGGEHGEGNGGDGKRDGRGGLAPTKKQKPFAFNEARFLSVARPRWGKEGHYYGRVSLTPLESGRAALSLREAGDTTSSPRQGLKLIWEANGSRISSESHELKRGSRVHVYIESEAQVDNCAWDIHLSRSDRLQ